MRFTPWVRDRFDYLTFPRKSKHLNDLRCPVGVLPDKQKANAKYSSSFQNYLVRSTGGTPGRKASSILNRINRQLFMVLGAACSMRNVRVTNELSVSNAVAGK